MPRDYYYEFGDLCIFKFKGIDAPFNIMGLPLFIDYYVTHSWNINLFEPATMRFLPNGRDVKPLPEKGELPSAERTLEVELATENEEDADSKALIVAVALGLLVIVGFSYLAVNAYSDQEIYVKILIILGGIVVAGLVFIIAYWVLLDSFSPGNTPVTVNDSNDAITRVNAGHVTFASLVSYAAYKVFRK